MRRRVASLVAILAAATAAPGAPAPASAEPAGAGALVRAACELPREQLVRTARGLRLDRGGEIQLIPREPNYVGAGFSHAGPWDYVQDVPLFWYGPGYVRAAGEIARPVTVADIAPTQAELLGFGFNAPDGRALTDALAPGPDRREPPRLVVTLVWDAAGRSVLETWPGEWPNLRRLIPQGAWYEHATVGSSPTNTPPIHATIGTGAFPWRHGVLDTFQRLGDTLEQPNKLGPGLLVRPTLADLYDRAMGNRPIVGAVATLAGHLNFMGHGSMWGGGDRDVAVTRELFEAAVGGAESTEWNLIPGMAPYYDFPDYANEVPGFEADKRALDRADGRADGNWGPNPIERLNEGFDTPARIPYQTRLIEEVVRREGFGDDDVPDLLYVNYKGIDRVGHLFSANGPEMGEMLRIQDAELPVLVDFLDREVGRGRWVMVLTADHGHQFDPAETGAVQISIGAIGRAIDAEFGDPGGGSLMGRVRPTQIWLRADAVRASGHSVEEIAGFVYGLTAADVAEQGTVVPPGLANQRVFAAVIPSAMLRGLPCLADAS